MLLGELGLGKPSQVAIITGDIEESKKNYAALFGLPVPPTGDGGKFEITKCEYMGKPAPDCGAKLAFFNFDGIQIELIEPYGADSTWKDWLIKTGGGLHHFGFQVADMDEAIAKCEAAGLKLTQKGLYGDGSGIYAYFDGMDTVKCFVELLHSF